MGLRRIISKIKKDSKETIPFESGKKIFEDLGVDIGKLNLPNKDKLDYHKWFTDLKLTPYMDLNELKIKITGNYIYHPADWHLDGMRNPKDQSYLSHGSPTSKIKIDTFGRIKN